MASHDLRAAIEKVDRTFSNWQITLREEDLPPDGEVRQIVQRGWTIKYLTGRDDRGRFLDYYATHRMTDDRHVRLYADGECEVLPAVQSLREASSDPEADSHLAAAFDRRQREILTMLDAKGFGLRGDQHGSLLTQRAAQFGEDLSGDR